MRPDLICLGSLGRGEDGKVEDLLGVAVRQQWQERRVDG